MRKSELPSGVSIYKDSVGDQAVWRVRLGKRFTGGAVVKKTFASYGAAKAWFDQQHQPKIQHGATYFELSPSQLAEARDAFGRLEQLKAEPRPTLTEAVSFFIKNARPAGGMRTLGSLKDDFLKSREGLNCKKSTIRGYRSYFNILSEEFGEVKLHEIRRQDIEDWLAESDWAPRTRKNYLVTLTTFFNYAVEFEYCASNPVAFIPRPIVDDAPPGILTVDQCKALIKTAGELTPELVPGIVIGLFAGLRRSEICALDWSEVDIDAKLIEIKATKAKTRQHRLTTIQPNLAQWLKPLAQKSGPVAPSVDVFGETLRWLVRGEEADGDRPARDPVVAEWPHNALRHSFGSYFYAQCKNENITAAEMGNSPAMVFKHYRTPVKPENVKAYWEITPPAD